MIFSCKALGAENPDCPDSGSGRFKAQEYHLPSGTGLDQLVIDGNDGRLKKEGNVSLETMIGMRQIRSPLGEMKPTEKISVLEAHSSVTNPPFASRSPTLISTSSH